MLLYLGVEFFFVAIPHLTCPDSYLSLAITSYFSNTSSKDLISYHETLLFLFLLCHFNLMNFVSYLILNIFQLGIRIPALGIYLDDCVQ